MHPAVSIVTTSVLLIAAAPAAFGGTAAPRRGAAPSGGFDPHRTRMDVSTGLGPWSLVSGSSRLTFTQSAPGQGTFSGTFAGAYTEGSHFTFPIQFEWNGEPYGAAAWLGYSSGAGRWTYSGFGSSFYEIVDQSVFALGGEFDFTPVKKPGLFFGVGPAFEYRSVSETWSDNCGTGVGIGNNRVTLSAGFFRLGGAARMRMWISPKLCVRAGMHILLFGFGSGAIDSSCPGSDVSYKGSVIAPTFLVEPGLAYRVHQMVSISADLGLHYQAFGLSSEETIQGVTVKEENSNSYVSFYVLPKILAHLHF